MGYRVYAIMCSDSSIYVGETGKSLRERFEEHCRGINSRLRNRTTPVRLLRDLCIKHIKTREESRSQERALAHRLREQGFHVRGGH